MRGWGFGLGYGEVGPKGVVWGGGSIVWAKGGGGIGPSFGQKWLGEECFFRE